MIRTFTRTQSLLLHGAGLCLLALAWTGGRELAAIGPGHAGHEPALAYLLALVIFLLASAGTALAAMGPRLFRKVAVADRWSQHVPVGFDRADKEEESA